MAEELSFVILNPSTLSKARTGGVLTRLLTRTALDLCGAMMFAPSTEMAEACAEALAADSLAGDDDPKVAALIRDYVRRHYAPDASTGQRQRLMVLLFQGEGAIDLIRDAVGDYDSPSIRNTYGDLVRSESGEVIYFEPAVFCPSSRDAAASMLKMLVAYAPTEAGLLEGTAANEDAADFERTLVMIKPDNFEFPCGRPGTIINIFSRTDLHIVAAKIHRMSVAEAEEFYGPVRPNIIEAMGPTAGAERFNNLVKFMSGYDPRLVENDETRKGPGAAKIMVLVYAGRDAVRKIRTVLGPTNPEKAPPGTIRRELGSTMMINTAHASDAQASANREMGILHIRDNTFSDTVKAYYG